MERIYKGFWIWLTFAEKDNIYLKELQKKVQKKLKSPNFQIHLTLYGPYETFSEELVLFVKKIANSEKAFTLETNNYGRKNEFFESFFIRIKESQKLISLRKEFSKFENKEKKFLYNPHISLSYGNFENTFKDDLMIVLPEIKNKLEIANLSVVKVNEDKLLWEELISFPLRANY